MPEQDIYFDTDHLVYSLDNVLIKIIVNIFKKNLTNKKNDEESNSPSVIKEIKKIKSNDLNVDKILIVLAYLDKLVYEKGNKFTRKCYSEIIKSDNPKFRLNALYLFFYYKLDDLFKKRALSKKKFINIISQHEFPEKIVNIICVLDKHKLFCETRLEEILSLSPQDLSCLEENLIKTHNEISKKDKNDIIFACLDDPNYKSLNNDEKCKLYKKRYVNAFIDKFYEGSDRTIAKSYAENDSQQKTSINLSSNTSESLIEKKINSNSEPKFIYVKKIYFILSDIIGNLKRKFINIIRYNNLRRVLSQYQDCMKNLEKEKNIQNFADILCQIGMLYEKNNNLPNKEQLNLIINDFIDANNCCKQQANILQWLNSSEYYDAAPEQRKFIKKYLDKILVESSFDPTQDLGSEHNDNSDILIKIV